MRRLPAKSRMRAETCVGEKGHRHLQSSLQKGNRATNSVPSNPTPPEKTPCLVFLDLDNTLIPTTWMMAQWRAPYENYHHTVDIERERTRRINDALFVSGLFDKLDRLFHELKHDLGVDMISIVTNAGSKTVEWFYLSYCIPQLKTLVVKHGITIQSTERWVKALGPPPDATQEDAFREFYTDVKYKEFDEVLRAFVPHLGTPQSDREHLDASTGWPSTPDGEAKGSGTSTSCACCQQQREVTTTTSNSSLHIDEDEMVNGSVGVHREGEIKEGWASEEKRAPATPSTCATITPYLISNGTDCSSLTSIPNPLAVDSHAKDIGENDVKRQTRQVGQIESGCGLMDNAAHTDRDRCSSCGLSTADPYTTRRRRRRSQRPPVDVVSVGDQMCEITAACRLTQEYPSSVRLTKLLIICDGMGPGIDLQTPASFVLQLEWLRLHLNKLLGDHDETLDCGDRAQWKVSPEKNNFLFAVSQPHRFSTPYPQLPTLPTTPTSSPRQDESGGEEIGTGAAAIGVEGAHDSSMGEVLNTQATQVHQHNAGEAAPAEGADARLHFIGRPQESIIPAQNASSTNTATPSTSKKRMTARSTNGKSSSSSKHRDGRRGSGKSGGGGGSGSTSSSTATSRMSSGGNSEGDDEGVVDESAEGGKTNLEMKRGESPPVGSDSTSEAIKSYALATNKGPSHVAEMFISSVTSTDISSGGSSETLRSSSSSYAALRSYQEGNDEGKGRDREDETELDLKEIKPNGDNKEASDEQEVEANDEAHFPRESHRHTTAGTISYGVEDPKHLGLHAVALPTPTVTAGGNELSSPTAVVGSTTLKRSAVVTYQHRVEGGGNETTAVRSSVLQFKEEEVSVVVADNFTGRAESDETIIPALKRMGGEMSEVAGVVVGDEEYLHQLATSQEKELIAGVAWQDVDHGAGHLLPCDEGVGQSG